MKTNQPLPKADTVSPAWQESVSKDTTGISRRGYWTLAMTVGLFAVWGFTFPISGAVVATGTLVKSGQNKLLQLSSSGVVKQILAKDGDQLDKGDLVAIIEPASAIAELAQLSARRDFLLSSKARLANGSDESLSLRGTIVNASSESTKSIFGAQQAQRDADLQRFNSEFSALDNQLLGLEGELASTLEQIQKTTLLVERLRDQYRKLKPLADAGHIAKSQVWDIETQQIEMETRIVTLEGNADNLNGRIEEIEDRKGILAATRNQDISRELTEILTELASIEEQIDSANKLVDSTQLRAPADGVITNLNIHTIGGVVSAGDVVAEIVPEAYPLQIEARILPSDINSVSIGDAAKVTITAFNARLQDPLDGAVNYIAADSQFDEATGQSYYLTRISLTADDELRSKLRSGMDAQVFVQTGDRTFFSYVAEPISDSFSRSFKER